MHTARHKIFPITARLVLISGDVESLMSRCNVARTTSLPRYSVKRCNIYKEFKFNKFHT